MNIFKTKSNGGTYCFYAVLQYPRFFKIYYCNGDIATIKYNLRTGLSKESKTVEKLLRKSNKNTIVSFEEFRSQWILSVNKMANSMLSSITEVQNHNLKLKQNDTI